VVLEGTEGAAVDGCVFSGIGGNALLLHRYNRRASITACEFAYVGDSAIVSLGEVQGIDGTARNVPVGTRVADNLGREIGLYTKQSGFYYHALSANATVTGNIAFNMPRAGISINDGYAGGHNISHNLIFNAVRETSDHGCLNTWDREPLMWDGARPDLCVVPRYATVLLIQVCEAAAYLYLAYLIDKRNFAALAEATFVPPSSVLAALDGDVRAEREEVLAVKAEAEAAARAKAAKAKAPHPSAKPGRRT
jgi:hypothetical protein